jgi:hypothetical protein
VIAAGPYHGLSVGVLIRGASMLGLVGVIRTPSATIAWVSDSAGLRKHAEGTVRSAQQNLSEVFIGLGYGNECRGDASATTWWPGGRIGLR